MMVRLVLCAFMAVMLTGCGVIQTSESSNGSSSGGSPSEGSGVGVGGEAERVAGPSWSGYMSVREGRECAYSSTVEGMGEISLTHKYTDVREESGGTRFTLESAMGIPAIAGEQYGEAEGDPLLSETESVEYVLGDDGLLRTEPQLFNSGDLEADVDRFIVYPSIEEVRDGESVSSSLTLAASSSDPATQAQLEAELEPGESEMKMRVDYKVTGVPPKEISTPAGTFTDVVGATVEIEDIEALNANEEARGDTDGLAEIVAAFAGTPTVWFARDTGIVQTETSGGMMGDGTSVMKLEGCDGERADAPPNPSTNEGELPEPTSLENGGDPDTEGNIGSSGGSGEASLEEEVGDYYRAAGAEEWGYTYDHIASETRSMFTEEEWFQKNQWFWDSNPSIYHIVSINPDSASPSAGVEVRITGEDGSSLTRTTYFSLEDGEWKHRFSEAETDLFMPGATFEEFVEAQTGTSPEDTPTPDGDTSGVCAGVSDCEMVDTADVDGDGLLDEISLVGEPDEYPVARTQFTVRVLLADGTTLTREAEIEHWHRDTAWWGATDFGQVPGEELVVGGTTGAHTLWFRVLAYRDGELVELPYPESDSSRDGSFYETMWPIDAAASVYMGVVCDTDDSTVVLPSVSSVGAPSEDATFEGEATAWILDAGQWRMIDSSNLKYPDASSAFEISGWQCGDLPRGYD